MFLINYNKTFSDERALMKLLKWIKKVLRLPYTLYKLLKFVKDNQSTLIQLTTNRTTLEQLANQKHAVDLSPIYISQALEKVSHVFTKKRTIIFDARGYFGDNIKYAYLAFVSKAKEKNINCYFLTEDLVQYNLLTQVGLPCMPLPFEEWGDKEMRILLETAVVFTCEHFYARKFKTPLPYALLAGAKKFQLWHGFPIKRVGFLNLRTAKYYLAHNSLAADMLASSITDAFLALSKSSKEMWLERLSFKDFLPFGFPRNDIFFKDLTNLDLLNVDDIAFKKVILANEQHRPVIFYTPTFRDFVGAHWFKDAKIDEIANFCKENNYLFLVNLHPYEQSAISELKKLYPSILFVEPHTDIHPLIKYTDILIVDYSSIIFDFLLLDRPLIFYRPDHKNYLANSRTLISQYVDNMPGEIVSTPQELQQSVSNAVKYQQKTSIDPFAKKREELRQEIFDHCDGNAAERVINWTEENYLPKE
jgi:CDP-glycerol glycerophosphotransferase